MHLQRIVLYLLFLLPLTFAWSNSSRDSVGDSKKLVKQYEELIKDSSKKNVYVIVAGTYYDNIRNIRYHHETAKIEVTIGYKNKADIYYFSPYEIEKLDAW